MREHNWEQFYEVEDPNRLWELMERDILEQANRLCPMKRLRVNARREPRSGRVRDWDAARRARNQVGRDLENLRADFLKRQQEENKADPKKFWKNISSIFPSKAGKVGNIWLKNQDDQKDIARGGGGGGGGGTQRISLTNILQI